MQLSLQSLELGNTYLSLNHASHVDLEYWKHLGFQSTLALSSQGFFQPHQIFLNDFFKKPNQVDTISSMQSSTNPTPWVSRATSLALSMAVPVSFPEPSWPPAIVCRRICSVSLPLPKMFPAFMRSGVCFYQENMWGAPPASWLLVNAAPWGREWGKLLTKSPAPNKYQAMLPFCQATQLPWFLLAGAIWISLTFSTRMGFFPSCWNIPLKYMDS